jgi:histidinol phosphatase-like PHP family hydrolase
MADDEDLNGTIAGWLRDMAAVQKSQSSRWGYKRAATAIRNLDEPVERYIKPDGTLQKIRHVGPASTRIILEVLQSGTSETVAKAVQESTRASQVESSRALRGRFLTRAGVLEALADPALGGPSPDAYKGDLQMHSTWSDGSQSIEEIVEACLARGYAYAAVTDHSYGLPIAGGLSMARLAEQHGLIDRLNRRYRGRFRLLKGIEANIRSDGSVDMDADELRCLEIVVAAPHAALRLEADQTPRMLRAIKTPGVNILGHPRGRMYGSRAGVQAHWRDIFAAAALAGVAVEIDGDPARQDIDYDLAAMAVGEGCLFALDSDAHGTADLIFAETALAHARLAGVPESRVVNCWRLDRLLDWAGRR